MRRETYVDRSEAGTVAGGHVLVEGLDSLAAGHLAVLLVHVVVAGARVVADPDTKVLDFHGVLLMDLQRHKVSTKAYQITVRRGMYLIESDDLAVGLLDLLQLGDEVPETRLGDDIVRRKDAHAVELGGRVALRGQVTPDDLVFVQTTCTASVSDGRRILSSCSKGSWLRPIVQWYEVTDSRYAAPSVAKPFDLPISISCVPDRLLKGLLLLIALLPSNRTIGRRVD